MGKRELIHPKYYAIDAYQILAKKSDEDMADILGISVRTYKDKKTGYLDFSVQQGDTIARVLKRTKDEIFLT